MTILALTHEPSPRMSACIRTHAVDGDDIDLDRARVQHRAYREALALAGAEVRVLDMNAEHPDAVFIEDNAVVLDEIAIITAMGAPARRPEPDGIAPVLATYRTIARLSSSLNEDMGAPLIRATLEGGDVIRVGKTLLVGTTARTNAEGMAALASIVRPFGYRVVPVPVSGCLHLKTACTALPDGALLMNPRWLSSSRDGLHDFEHVLVHDDEPHAANVVVVGEDIVMAAAHPRTAERVARHARKVHAVALTEFAKADGCATCLSLVFTKERDDARRR